MMTRLWQFMQAGLTSLNAMTWPVAAVLGAALLVGVGLLLAGWRGRRINDHPMCGRCRFDLVGIHPGGSRCPECGAVLSGEGARRRAVRNGLRRRRWLVVLAGLAFALASVSGFGWVGYREARAYDWNRAKPVWWILGEIESAKPTRYPALVDELLRRAQEDLLSPTQYRKLLTLTRERQQDAVQPWDPRWGYLVELGYDHGKIDNGEFNRYLDGIIQGKLKVRKKVRAGAALPAELRVEFRGGQLGWGGWEGERELLKIAGRTYDHPSGGRIVRAGRPVSRMRSAPKYLGEWTYAMHADLADLTGHFSVQFHERWPLTAPEKPGSYTFATRWSFKPADGSSELWGVGSASVFQAAAARLFEREFSASFTVVPEDEPTVRLSTDGSQALVMAAAFTVKRYDPTILDGMFDATTTPLPYAFDVFARVDGREIPLGSLAPMPNDPLDVRDTRQFMLREPVPVGSTVSYVLRPSPETAEMTVDLDEIWGEEIFIEETPVLPVEALLK